MTKLNSACVEHRLRATGRTAMWTYPFVLLTVALAVGGCVTPWSASNVALPSTKTTPTLIDDAAIPEVFIEAGEDAATNDEPTADVIIRGQSPDELAPGSQRHYRDAMPISGVDPGIMRPGPQVRPVQYEAPADYQPLPSAGNAPYPYGAPGGYDDGADVYSSPPIGYEGGPGGYAPGGYAPGNYGASAPAGIPSSAQGFGAPAYAPYDGSGTGQPNPMAGLNPYGVGGVVEPSPAEYADLVVNLRETQTGRFMFGVGVNSDLGLTAQVVIDERHFDWRAWPRSIDDVFNGTAWRGGGQSLRIEAVPGSQVQRYLVNFTQPYLNGTNWSLNLSGYLFDRRYYDWAEQRLGGRVGLGYRITPDLALSLGLRGEQVDFYDPRVLGIPQIDDVVGKNDLFSGKVTLTHDTRDIPFAPTQGHYLEMSYEQVFGDFDYPRGGLDYRRYFMLRERADRSGRHTLGFSFRGGISGSQTPVFENYFAGGYSTMRGFRFRHASPKINDVIVGGQLELLGSAEYIFPITADDMLKGAVFTDYGTVEETLNVDWQDFRVAVGAGLRISVPAMGPAPISVDLAIPVAREDTDRIQNFSFSVGFNR